MAPSRSEQNVCLLTELPESPPATVTVTTTTTTAPTTAVAIHHPRRERRFAGGAPDTWGYGARACSTHCEPFQTRCVVQFEPSQNRCTRWSAGSVYHPVGVLIATVPRSATGPLPAEPSTTMRPATRGTQC